MQVLDMAGRARKQAPEPSIPYLRPGAVIVVIGEEKYVAAEQLKVVAAEGLQRCIEFTGNAYLAPGRYAELMRDTARTTGCPVLMVPPPRHREDIHRSCGPDRRRAGRCREPGVANSPRWGRFQHHLARLFGVVCRFLTPLLLAGAVVLNNTHLARPTIGLPRPEPWPTDWLPYRALPDLVVH